ncbi:putative membrane protein [Povalibacter uvarum]|uniref:Putative membrane protein n=1 Tax=Povalibacter uvarum TaxID=732238 RepID=A0A841HDX9_9GAMM|nr:AzlD domain-containing protein [Povalibacter uvarum]MBB6091301.1 putative membrane protein [Povalibacter uvarum]
MSLWGWILLASFVAYVTKFSGYLVPAHLLQNERMNYVAATLTIGLLASLTAMNAFSAGQTLALDARAGSLIVAAVALALRAPFLGVVIVGAVTAAALRAAGVAQ